MGELTSGIVHYVLAPTNAVEITVYYLIWVVLFFAVNVLWDIRTDKTPDFHFLRLTTKIDVAHNAVSFCSSLLVIVGLLDREVGKLATDAIAPLLLAGLSGVLKSLPALCPYSMAEIRNGGNDGAAA